MPYLVGVLELAEGPRMLSNFIGMPIDQVSIGMALTVVFVPITEEIVLPGLKGITEK